MDYGLVYLGPVGMACSVFDGKIEQHQLTKPLDL